MVFSVDSMIKKYLTLYSSETPRWDDISDLAEALEFSDMTQKTMLDYLTEHGVSQQYAQELVEAATRVNYGQVTLYRYRLPTYSYLWFRIECRPNSRVRGSVFHGCQSGYWNQRWQFPNIREIPGILQSNGIHEYPRRIHLAIGRILQVLDSQDFYSIKNLFIRHSGCPFPPNSHRSANIHC